MNVKLVPFQDEHEELIAFQLADLVFSYDESKIRIEGHTPSDNYAMRKTFVKAGFGKEGFHRKAWPQNDGMIYDSVSYAIARRLGQWHIDTGSLG